MNRNNFACTGRQEDVARQKGEKIYFPIYSEEEIREGALKADAPTYACVGTCDGIDSWNTMKKGWGFQQSFTNTRVYLMGLVSGLERW